jgi:hypothetical protein
MSALYELVAYKALDLKAWKSCDHALWMDAGKVMAWVTLGWSIDP